MAVDTPEDYLIKHRVPERLEALLQDLAKKQPADPGEYIRSWTLCNWDKAPEGPGTQLVTARISAEPGSALAFCHAVASSAPMREAGRQRGQWREHIAQHPHPKAGQVFYLNTVTGEKRWNTPPEFGGSDDNQPPAASSMAVDDSWQAVRTPDGRTFWHNKHTREKTWDRPHGAPEAPPPPVGHPSDWRMYISDKPGKEGQRWWHNILTGEKTWTCPPGVAPEDAPAQAPSAPPTQPADNDQYVECKSQDGRSFYFCHATGRKTWDRPANVVSSPTAAAAVAAPQQQSHSEWKIHSCEKPGRGTQYFWHNPVTGEKTWQQPPGAPAAPQASGSTTPPAAAREAAPSAAAPIAAPPAPESEWQVCVATEGRVFWYNRRTKEKTWDKPAGAPAAPSASVDPSEWEQVTMADGRVFWHNPRTKEKSWDRPGAQTQGPPERNPDNLPPGWAAHSTDEGRTFYYNRDTGKKQWHKPEN
eukprot:TRINITY_DN46908_c0_g1_i1.p1 TRINITY_DN46908_c0_g1~~TRINITY_DN46908_c0_g1_i1.p1  ORF type:complete len:515 (+),score=122.49 TRINITY_DN46908_c0_g1_i1:127-1545(+)